MTRRKDILGILMDIEKRLGYLERWATGGVSVTGAADTGGDGGDVPCELGETVGLITRRARNNDGSIMRPDEACDALDFRFNDLEGAALLEATLREDLVGRLRLGYWSSPGVTVLPNSVRVDAEAIYPKVFGQYTATVAPGTELGQISSHTNLQDAIDAVAASGGGTIFVAPGTYSGDIVIPADIGWLVIQGTYQESTIVYGSFTCAFDENIAEVRIEGLTCQGISLAAVANSGAMVDRVAIHGVLVNKGSNAGNGISISDVGRQAIISDCIVEWDVGSSVATGHGVSVSGNGSVIVRGSLISRSPQHGIYVTTDKTLVYDNVLITPASNGICHYAATEVYCQISENIIHTSGRRPIALLGAGSKRGINLIGNMYPNSASDIELSAGVEAAYFRMDRDGMSGDFDFSTARMITPYGAGKPDTPQHGEVWTDEETGGTYRYNSEVGQWLPFQGMAGSQQRSFHHEPHWKSLFDNEAIITEEWDEGTDWPSMVIRLGGRLFRLAPDREIVQGYLNAAAVLLGTSSPSSFMMDTILRGSVSSSFSLDAYLAALQVQGFFACDAAIAFRHYPRSFVTSAFLGRVQRYFSADAYLA